MPVVSKVGKNRKHVRNFYAKYLILWLLLPYITVKFLSRKATDDNMLNTRLS